jgi:uncharacterized protein
MFIDIHELELHQIEFAERFQPAAIDLGPEIRQTELLSAIGHADLVEEHRGGKRKKIQDIRLVGKLLTRVEMNCARCLEPVVRVVDREFDLLYRPEGIDGGEEERAVNEADTEIGYYQGEGLLLEDVLREQILLALPMRLVCSDACKGLCPQCGGNLNVETCSCAPPADPRWQALNGLKDKLHQ